MALIDEQDAIPVVIDRWEIDAVGIEEEIRCEMCENPMHTDRGCDGLCSYDKDLYKRIIKVLNERMKPLQPDVPGMNVGDMISRQAAMERLMAQNVIMDGSEYHNGFNAGVNRAQEVIRNLPPVQPNHNAEVSKMEIIHCKDCNHYWKSKKWCICGRYVKETGFCDMADRKGEEDGTDL